MRTTYKKFLGYRPGVAVIGDLIVGIENRRTKQEQRQSLLWLCLARRRKPKGQQRRQHKCTFPPEGHAEEVLWKVWTERIDSQSFQGRLRILLRGNCGRGSDSKQQATSRRLSSGSSLCQQSGSGHQGSMCWISIHATTLMQICFRMTLDNTDNLWSWYCVLPQVALWGKGILCVFMLILVMLRPLLPQCRYLFDLCVILWGRLRIWGFKRKTI